MAVETLGALPSFFGEKKGLYTGPQTSSPAMKDEANLIISLSKEELVCNRRGKDLKPIILGTTGGPYTYFQV
jgi:hypothetical protein